MKKIITILFTIISFYSKAQSDTSTFTLPITLNDFRASNIDNINKVHWQVNCLSTSVTFELQRSSTTENFKPIYNKNETKARCAAPFDYNDTNPLTGYNYYRLKIINIDGVAFYSKISIANNSSLNNKKFKITPNVVSTNAELHYITSSEEKIELVITDMQGRIVKKLSAVAIPGDNKILIQANTFSKGQYQVTLFSKVKGKVGGAVFIKE